MRRKTTGVSPIALFPEGGTLIVVFPPRLPELDIAARLPQIAGVADRRKAENMLPKIIIKLLSRDLTIPFLDGIIIYAKSIAIRGVSSVG